MQWTTNRTGNGPEITFEMDGAHSIMATIAKPYMVFPESKINIEATNAVSLLRGMPQKVFNLSKLSPDQKTAIFESIPRRKISINGYSRDDAHIVIHAV